MGVFLHSTDEAHPLSIMKDLYFILGLIFMASYPVANAEEGLAAVLFVSMMWLGPLVFYWTPFVQKKLSLSALPTSQNVKYQWGIFLIMLFLPVIGILAPLLLLIFKYNDSLQNPEEIFSSGLYKEDTIGNGKAEEDVSEESGTGNQTSESSSEENDGFSGPTVKEYKRVCNECGEEWHSLVSREKKLKRRGGIESTQECLSGLTCNYDAAAQERKNRQDTESELENLKKCPECNSRNYDEEVIEYEK